MTCTFSTETAEEFVRVKHFLSKLRFEISDKGRTWSNYQGLMTLSESEEFKKLGLQCASHPSSISIANIFFLYTIKNNKENLRI